MRFIYPYASLKDVQATGEPFSPQKRTSSTQNMNFLRFFLFEAGSGYKWMYFVSPNALRCTNKCESILIIAILKL